jgi:hypothetical protein
MHGGDVILHCAAHHNKKTRTGNGCGFFCCALIFQGKVGSYGISLSDFLKK